MTISFLSIERSVPRKVTTGVTPGMPLVAVPIERPRRWRPYCPKTNPGRTASNRQTKRILDSISGLLRIVSLPSLDGSATPPTNVCRMQYILGMGLRRIACLLIFSAPVLLSQHPAGADVSAGQKLFQKSCSSCHGENAKGGRGPDLTTGDWRWGGSNSAILQNILSGIPNTQMPAFPMTAADGELIVAYLRSLESNAPDERLEGDSEAGRKLFFGSAKCGQCHMFGGRGGRLGPDLSEIRNQKKTVELREDIVTPDKSLRKNYET